MPPKVPAKPIQIPLEPLTRSSFAPFGYVIENPPPAAASTHPPAPSSPSAFPAPVPANQGTALKYPDISRLTSTYHLSSRPETAQPVISLFVCAPRRLRPLPGRTSYAGGGIGAGLLDVAILERHPYTTQTFSPLGLSPSSSSDARTAYIVVVAPTQRAGPEAGRPNLANVRAFLAGGGQAVTYGVGTWHAPMVVVGEEGVGFVVVQVANGTGDDCEEITVGAEGVEGGVEVVVEELKLGIRSEK